ncbi:MAG: cytochrome c biogenesis protein ResB [Chloroflexi bacterium]|nr:cytochrome c biogenesis protein ResB [Chloroflexota bacterium]
MTTTFFMPRRRVWARVTAGRVQLAGQAGHGIDLTSELERLVTGEEPPKRKLRLAPRRGLFGGDYAQPEDGRRDDA